MEPGVGSAIGAVTGAVIFATGNVVSFPAKDGLRIMLFESAWSDQDGLGTSRMFKGVRDGRV